MRLSIFLVAMLASVSFAGCAVELPEDETIEITTEENEDDGTPPKPVMTTVL